MSRTIVTEPSPEDRAVNKYLGKCFQKLLNQVGLEYSYGFSYRNEKRCGMHGDRINVPQKGLVKKFFLAPETIADIKRLPFREESERLKLEIRVLDSDYLEEIKTVVTEANEYHRVNIRISE